LAVTYNNPEGPTREVTPTPIAAEPIRRSTRRRPLGLMAGLIAVGLTGGFAITLIIENSSGTASTKTASSGTVPCACRKLCPGPLSKAFRAT
jgi:hypothetical protein